MENKIICKDINGTPLKVGDRIKRIEPPVAFTSEMVEGNIYTIEEIQSDVRLKLKETSDNGGWKAYKFKKMSRKEYLPAWW